MRFQSLVDSVRMACCVISVEKVQDGTYGRINIVRANRAYKELMGGGYYDDMPYDELVPKDNKFEGFCYRSAIRGEKLHSYVETKALHAWTDMTLIPLASDEPNVGYCLFFVELTQYAEADRVASVSATTAEEVIKVSYKLMAKGNFTDNIENVMGDLLSFSGAAACRILLVNHEKQEVSLYAEKVALDVWADRKPILQIVDYDLVKTWKRLLGVSNDIIVTDDHDMEMLSQVNAAWAANMREHEIHSLVLIPLHGGEDVIGYLYVVNFDTEKVVAVKEVVELMAFFLGSQIHNHVLLERLEELSNVDELTGLYNRRAMIRKMERINRRKPGLPYGIVNIDLNGLKTVNDHAGHAAGDRMLIQTGEMLRKVFYLDDLFRTGGDEFVVMIEMIDRETFARKVDRLRSDVSKNASISFSIGAYWSDGGEAIASAMRKADDRMYEDKMRFYAAHPELSRK